MRTIFFFFVFICCSNRLMAQEEQVKVYFETDKSDIPDSAMVRLVRLVGQHRIARVLIEGHCDSVGSRAYNYALSQKRAQAVFRLLFQNGIPKNRIKTCMGYGKDKPITENRNEQERQLNRRVLVTFFFDEEQSKPSLSATISPSSDPVKPEEAAPYVLIQGDSISEKTLKPGARLVFENLLFEPGRHILKEESTPVLRKVFFLLSDNPSLELEIQGHVCCTTIERDGHDWDTGFDNLSEARARVVYQYLVSNGIEKIRLEYKGYGGQEKLSKMNRWKKIAD